MKIIHFISGVRSGGVEQLLINYTKLLNLNDDYSEVVVYQHSPESVCLNKLKLAGNKCIQISDKRKHPFKNLIDTYKIIKKEQPDIVHCHMSLLNFFPLFIAKLAGVKIRISHAHISRNNIGNDKMADVFKFLCKLLATNLFACGNDAGKYMYGKSKFTVINNAVYIDKYERELNVSYNLKAELGISSDSVIIGHVGRFVEQKNHKRLLCIFKEYLRFEPKAYLMLIGTGELQSKIESYAMDLNIKNRVIFIGNVPDVIPYYNIMSLFLLPSLYEGLPVVAIEAQCAGVPMLISDVIDKDAVILNTTRTLSLDVDNRIWINNMINMKNQGKMNIQDARNKMKKSGYSIYESARKLQKIYDKMLLEV